MNCLSSEASAQFDVDNTYTAAVTVISSISPSILTKTYELDAEGGISSPSTSAKMVSGKADVRNISSVIDLREILLSLEHNQAMVWGIPQEKGCIPVYSLKEYERLGRPVDAITRSNETFHWAPGGGVMMLDFDFKGRSHSKEQVIQIISEIVPGLSQAAFLWWCSASSYIYNGDDELQGLRGQRLYILVRDATDIERAGKALFDRLWLAGHGFYEISRAGSFLTRSLIDNSVWQPSRLDFAGGAHCTPPLNQRRPIPDIHEGVPLDTTKEIPDLIDKERAQLEAIKAKMKAELHAEAASIRDHYIEKKARENLANVGNVDPTAVDIEQSKLSVKRALESSTLAGDFVIYLDDGSAVTVGDILDDPARYHRVKTKDPIEPDYDKGRTVGITYLFNGRPTLFSQAHGGKSYRLIRQPREIEHASGHTFETVNASLQLLRELPDFYDMGGQLVTIEGGQTKTLNIDLLPYYLASVIQYFVYKDRKGELIKQFIDPPLNVVKQILALGAGRKLKPLKAVISAPVITVDNHIIDRAGYDSKTQLYLATDDTPLPVAQEVGSAEVNTALDFLMKPFSDFPFAGPIDRSICLSALLTAVVRPVLDTAPAIAIDAPKQGTGKTYLARCIGYLSTGMDVSPMPSLEKNDDEIRKRLFSALIRGARVILWDNVMGLFNSASLATFLTGPSFSDRILGRSETIELPNKALFLITGNNLQIAGELPRRVLICRLDSGLENPTTRSFNFNPLHYVIQNRLALVQAALTIVRGYLQSTDHIFFGGVKEDKLASFEDWDCLVRQVVAWIGIENKNYVDPKKAIDDNVMDDPEQEILADLLMGLKNLKGSQSFTAKEVLDAIEFQDSPLQEIFRDILLGKPVVAKSVGRVLSYRRDRIAGGLKLSMSKSGKHAAQFRVDTV